MSFPSIPWETFHTFPHISTQLKKLKKYIRFGSRIKTRQFENITKLPLNKNMIQFEIGTRQFHFKRTCFHKLLRIQISSIFTISHKIQRSCGNTIKGQTKLHLKLTNLITKKEILKESPQISWAKRGEKPMRIKVRKIMCNMHRSDIFKVYDCVFLGFNFQGLEVRLSKASIRIWILRMQGIIFEGLSLGH